MSELTDEQLAELQTQAGQVPELQAGTAQRDREIAFLRAGVDTSTLIGRNVMNEHGDGELTAEAITETQERVREELGLPDPADEETEEEARDRQFQEQQERIRNGQLPVGTRPEIPSKSLQDEVIDTYVDARKSGRGETEAIELGISHLIHAAQKDPTGPAAYSKAQFRQDATERHGHGSEYAGLPERSYDRVVQEAR